MRTSLDASTVTPGRTAPELSRTTPVMVLWAAARAGASSTKETTTDSLSVLDMPPPYVSRCECANPSR